MEQPPPTATDIPSSSDEDAQPELTHVPQSNSPSLPTTSPLLDSVFIDETAPLSFPTLSPDGSIDDLTSASHHSSTPTPPAALSQLGRRARMPHTSMFDSSSSLDDIQYDMIDDVSDFSNDDRETASLASTERGDGQMTPEGSIVDLEEERDDLDASTTLRGTLETLQDSRTTQIDDRARAENAVFDSYMTDDLETPRQSLMHGHVFEQPPTRQSGAEQGPKLHQQSQTYEESPIRLLFVADSSVGEAEVTDVCQHLAESLATKKGSTGRPTAVRLPPPPSSTTQLPPMYIIAGDVELIVERCVHASDAQSSTPSEYPFTIRSGGHERVAIFSLDDEGTRDIEVPDLVVYYLSPGQGYPAWYGHVKNAMGDRVARITLGAPGFSFNNLVGSEKTFAYNSDLVLSNTQFFDGYEDDLRTDLEILLERKPKATSYSKARSVGSMKALSGFKPTKQSLLVLIALVQLLLAFGWWSHDMYSLFAARSSPIADVSVRRAALSNALVEFTNATHAPEFFNVQHLIPENQTSPTAIFCSGVVPNHLVVSLPPKTNGRGFSSPTAWNVFRPHGSNITHNVTKLTPGVYHISIQLDEAYGLIHTDVFLQDPSLHGTCVMELGSRILQRRTYEKMSTEISKIINKDVALASQRVRSLTEKLGVELSAGAAASRNVTTQLAVYVARDLQVFAHTAVSVFEKLSEEGQGAMERLGDRIRHDVQNGAIHAQRGLYKLHESAQKSLQTTSQFTKDLIPTKKTVRDSLAGARERALSVKNSLSGLTKDTNSTSATKELSLRLQNLFKQSENGKRAGSLKDIAKCMRAEDYRACRREQRKNAKSLSAYKPPSALAKLPEVDVLKNAAKEHKPIRPIRGMNADLKPSMTGADAKGKKCKRGARKAGKNVR